MTVTHSFTSTKSDGGDTTVVRPSDWNADHVIANYSVRCTEASQTIDSATWTEMLFSTEDWDDGDWHSTSTNTGRFTPPTGITKVSISVVSRISGSTAGQYYVRVLKDGSQYGGSLSVAGTTAGGNGVQVHYTDEINATSSNYITFEAYQDSGGTRNWDYRVTLRGYN